MSRYATRLLDDGELANSGVRSTGLHPGDIVIIVLYFLATLGVGIYVRI